MVAILGHFDGKVFVPDEPVNLPNGQAVIVHVRGSDDNPKPSGPHILEWAAENLVAKTDHPADGAEQHDHYLYGTPKKHPESP